MYLFNLFLLILSIALSLISIYRLFKDYIDERSSSKELTELVDKGLAEIAERRRLREQDD